MENQMEQKCVCGCGSGCKCPHHKMMPLLVVLFGVLFLLHNWGMFSDGFVAIAWPSIVILAGLKKMFSGMCKCCSVK